MTATMKDESTSATPPTSPRPRTRRTRRPAPKPRRTRPTTPARASAVVGRSEVTSTFLSSTFTMVTIVCLWVAAQLVFLGAISQQRAQDLLYEDFRADLAGAVAPVGPAVPVGAPVALLSIPSLGLEQVVVEGTASGDLLAGPGHRRDTPLPGQEGVSAVYGRGATYGAPFRDITDLVRGDVIRVTNGQGRVKFRVLGVRRAGDPLPQPVADGKARLTLVTAEGSGRLGALSPETVVYVDADAKKAFPAPPGRPTAVPESEKAMSNDESALPLLALYLALLLALTLGVFAARQRWSTVLVWVVACPLAIALSWASTDVVMRLLPNLL